MLLRVWRVHSIALILSMISFEYGIVYGKAHSSPNLINMASAVGSKMKISCVSNSSIRVHWYHSKNRGEVAEKINDGTKVKLKNFSNFFATGDIPGQTLETNATRSENAGLLQCKTSGNEIDAHLTVLDSEPTCTCNVILVSKDLSTRAELYCSIGYNGFWPPTLEWIRLKDNKKIEDGHFNITANKVTLTMQVNADNTAAVYTEYYCRTFFSNETRPSNGAANIPDYNSSCTPTEENMASTPAVNDESSNASGGGYVIWIITGFAGAACIVVLGVIIVFLRRNPEVCRKSSEPDIMQLADVVQNADINMVMENRVDDHREDEADEEPEQRQGALYHNRVYAEVEVCERELLPPYMYDSPAWSGSSGIKNGKGIQYSPACSHQSRTGTPRNAASRSGTPRSESPNIAMENVEYLDINSVATIPTPQMQRTQQQQMPRRPPARLPITTSNKFQPAMYASIDHTSRPPPPLPPNDDY